MNNHKDASDSLHTPTPAFRAFLEYEVVRTAGRTSRRQRRMVHARLAVLALVCVGVGVTTTLASAQVRKGAQRDSLLESARADLMIAGVRLNLTKAQSAAVSRQAQVGAASAADQRKAELSMRTMEARAMRAKYNIAEITRTAQAPRDDLNAPLVDDTDFVKARLQLRATVAQQRLQDAEAALKEARDRVRVGAENALEALHAEQLVTKAQADFVVLAIKLNLRRKYLAQHTPADSLMAELAHAQFQQDVIVAQERVKVARRQYTLMQKQRASGVATALDLLQAEVEMQVSELELKRLVERLREQ